MAGYIIRRLMQAVVVLIIVSFIAFSILYVLPGDAALIMLGLEATPEQINALRQELGLNQPMLVQYGQWFFKILQGDFGKSIVYRDSVADLIGKRLPVTFHLGLVALIISIIISIPAGILSAVRRGSILDSVITISANIGMAIPIFWLGILGIYFFSLKLGWLPVYGYTSPFDNFWLSTKQMIMPAICLAVVPMATLTRQTRSSMLEVIRQDYIRTARSKGLKERTVLIRHALKNAIIPIVTLLGLQIRNLVGGSVLVETIFTIPGMGRLMVSGVFDKDFPVVQGGIMVIALVVVLANLIVDLSYGYFDPRIRNE
ncbi:MAG: ABC transporter permease [Clostridia bacterium]|nr:ABC transporter permease [Clostridia bacterium]